MSDDIVTRLRAVFHSDRSVEMMNREAADEIELLRAERDVARRAVCCSALPSDYKEWKPETVNAMVRLIAAQEGWDCYKEKP